MAGSDPRESIIHPLQTRVVNPIVMLAHNLGIPPPGDALLETTGRRTGRPVHTPMCDGLDGDVFWLIAQRGHRADWVRNIEANPRVRVKVRTAAGVVWRAGTAYILDEDDPRERQRLMSQGSLARRLCVGASAAMATDALTVRIDLDTQLAGALALKTSGGTGAFQVADSEGFRRAECARESHAARGRRGRRPGEHGGGERVGIPAGQVRGGEPMAVGVGGYGHHVRDDALCPGPGPAALDPAGQRVEGPVRGGQAG